MPGAQDGWRLLTDDVSGDRSGWLLNGRAGPDGLSPHQDMLPGFPFLGPPSA